METGNTTNMIFKNCYKLVHKRFLSIKEKISLTELLKRLCHRFSCNSAEHQFNNSSRNSKH